MSAAVVRSAPLVERWSNVERVLKGMTEHERRFHWNMSTWGEKTDCGTVACAAGQCGLDAWFRRRGFRLDFDKKTKRAQISDVAEFFGFEGSQRIFFNAKPRSVKTVTSEVHSYVIELKKLEKLVDGRNLPKIGEEWPEQGGIYSGPRLGKKGQPNYLLVVGPEYDGYANHAKATAWSKDLVVGEHSDFALPDRGEGIALYDRVKPLFQNSWYWLATQHATLSDYAYVQYFNYGYQCNTHESISSRARAVRRVPIR